jgi:hypothetical protein
MMILNKTPPKKRLSKKRMLPPASRQRTHRRCALARRALWRANSDTFGKSATRQWLGAAITMKQHMKIQPFLLDLVKDKVGKMKDHQDCVKISFMDKLQVHYPYMRTIRGCSEALQKPGCMLVLGERQMILLQRYKAKMVLEDLCLTNVT